MNSILISNRVRDFELNRIDYINTNGEEYFGTLWMFVDGFTHVSCSHIKKICWWFGKIDAIVANDAQRSKWVAVCIYESHFVGVLLPKVRLVGWNPPCKRYKSQLQHLSDDVNRMTASFTRILFNWLIYPLTTTQLLIQLSTLVAIFSPILKSLIPLEAINPQISRKLHDILVYYRPRVVSACLHKFFGWICIGFWVVHNQRATSIWHAFPFSYHFICCFASIV